MADSVDEAGESRVARRRREREAAKNNEVGDGATGGAPKKTGGRFKERKGKSTKPQDKRNVREKRRATGIIRLDGVIMDEEEKDEEVKVNTEINQTIATDQEGSISAHKSSVSSHDVPTTNSDVPISTSPNVSMLSSPDVSIVTSPDVSIVTSPDVSIIVTSPDVSIVTTTQETDQLEKDSNTSLEHLEKDSNTSLEQVEKDSEEFQEHLEKDSEEFQEHLEKDSANPLEHLEKDPEKSHGIEQPLEDNNNTQTNRVDSKDKTIGMEEDKEETNETKETSDVKEDGDITMPEAKTSPLDLNLVDLPHVVSRTHDLQTDGQSPRTRRAWRTRQCHSLISTDPNDLHTMYLPPDSPTENYKKLYDRERRETRRLTRRLAESEQAVNRMHEEMERLKKYLVDAENEIDRLQEENDALVSAVTKLSLS